MSTSYPNPPAPRGSGHLLQSTADGRSTNGPALEHPTGGLLRRFRCACHHVDRVVPIGPVEMQWSVS